VSRWTWTVLALALTLAPGCAKHAATESSWRVSADDPQMNRAKAKARTTVGTFIAALRSPRPARAGFSIKLPITDGDQVEHFWLRDVRYDGTVFHGLIDNDPEMVTTVKFGQPVTVRPANISDWMYVDHGILVGGYTVRVFRDSLSPSERADFDKSLWYKVK
jgi:uncharacterized protein YegJ (DUF2314 family)